MAAPLIEAGDITESGNNTASSSWAVSYPNASAGDLLIFNLGWDDSTTTSSVTAPAGPNGEVLSSIAGPVASNSTEVRGQSWFTIATGTWTASTLTFTPSASEQWTAGVIKVPAGEFDPRDPIGAASTRASADTADTTVDSVGYAIGAADGGGTLVWFAIVDTVALGSLSSGWTSRVTRDRGAVAIGIATRNAATTASETTSSTDTWGISADSWASIAYVVRPPPSLYYVIYGSAGSNPSAAQVKAGQDATGSAAVASGNEDARDTTGEQVFADAATGLSAGTSYRVAFVWDDGTNSSNVAVSDAWVTTDPKVVAVPKGTLTLTSYVPSVVTSDHKLVAVPKGTLSLSTFVPSVQISDHKKVDVPLGSLSLTSYQPSVVASDHKLVSVPKGELSLSSFVPLVAVTDNKTVDVPLGTLSLSAVAPFVTASDHKKIDVPHGSLLLFGLAPTVTATAHVTVSIPADALSLSTFVPTVTATENVLISVPLATLSLAAEAPLILAGASMIVQVPKGTLTLAAEAPAVATTANQVVSVPKAELTLTSYEPSVVAAANQKVDVPAASLELTGYAPTISANGDTVISVPFASLELTLNAPTIITPRVVSIPKAVLELVAHTPTIITPRLIDVPSTSLALTSFAPEVHTTAVIEIPAASLTITGYAPTIDASSGGGSTTTRVTWG